MIDIDNLDKNIFDDYNGIKKKSEITLDDLCNYGHGVGFDKIFDKNIKILSAKDFEGWGEIPSKEEIDESDGVVWMAGRQYLANYICYAFKILNFKEKTIIGHQIVCLNECFMLPQNFHYSFKELYDDLEKVFNLNGNWEEKYLHHSFG